MKRLNFVDCEDLACAMADMYDEITVGEAYADIEAIAKFDEAKEIISALVCMGYDIRSIEIDDPDLNNYDGEYMVSLMDKEIWCEKARNEKGYLYSECDVVYLLDNCSSKIIPYIEAGHVYEVHVDSEDEDWDEDECEHCCDTDCPSHPANKKKEHVAQSVKKSEPESNHELLRDEDGRLHGFTASQSDEHGYRSRSFYTTEDLAEDEIKSLMRFWGI